MLSTAYFGPESSPAANSAVGDFVSELIWGIKGAVRDYCAMGVFEGQNLVAGTLYHNWQPEAGVIELTSASLDKRWLTRPVVRSMFRLPFDVLSCQMVVLRVSERNKRMIRIARSFGFSETLIPRLRGRDEAEYIFFYTDDQWRTSPYNDEAR
jgi:RimJ/RimL family protein N-acetyltransferase